MDKLKIAFENCHGINKLNHTFNFEEDNVAIIYAPNGVMKTSFAETFKNFKNKEETTGGRKGQKISQLSIKDENNNEIKDEIIIINSEDKNNKIFKPEIADLLLASQELRKKYKECADEINSKKESLLKKIFTLGGFKRRTDEVEEALADIFGRSNLLDVLNSFDIDKLEDSYLSHVKYKDIFNSKVEEYVDPQKEKLKEYLDRYKELVKKSPVFKEGVFDDYNLEEAGKSLKKNKFFNAGHSINLDGEKDSINQDELDSILKREKENILGDKKLKKIKKALERNQKGRNFKSIITKNPKILDLFLNNKKKLKKELFNAYLFDSKDLLQDLQNAYEKNKKRIKEIKKEARKQKSKWSEVIEKFNERFIDQPLKVKVNDKASAVVGEKSASFTFEFRDDEAKFEEEKKAIETLSGGEKRAIYFLDIIFKLETCNKDKDYLLIIDDIADSLDYRNKYAFLEYLKNYSEKDNFKMILMTHNFDFFRGVGMRMIKKRYKNSFLAVRNDKEINLIKAGYFKNPLNHFKRKCHKKESYFLATIPLVRELVQIKKGDKADEYERLTKLLHIKDKSFDIEVGKTFEIFKEYLSVPELEIDESDKVLNLLFKVAESIEDKDDEFYLQRKIVLAMAIRLKAEEFMIKRLEKEGVTDPRKDKETTRELFEKLKKKEVLEKEKEANLDRVNLITPDFVHINSFMFEPLVDISICELKSLYKSVKNLKI